MHYEFIWWVIYSVFISFLIKLIQSLISFLKKCLRLSISFLKKYLQSFISFLKIMIWHLLFKHVISIYWKLTNTFLINIYIFFILARGLIFSVDARSNVCLSETVSIPDKNCQLSLIYSQTYRAICQIINKVPFISREFPQAVFLVDNIKSLSCRLTLIRNINWLNYFIVPAFKGILTFGSDSSLFIQNI